MSTDQAPPANNNSFIQPLNPLDPDVPAQHTEITAEMALDPQQKVAGTKPEKAANQGAIEPVGASETHLDSTLPPLRCGMGAEERGEMGWRTEDNWTKIMVHDLQKYAEEGRRKARELALRKQKVREELERQMRDKQHQKESERRAQLQYDEELVAIGRGLEQREQKRTTDRLEHVRQEKQLRDQQLRGTSKVFNIFRGARPPTEAAGSRARPRAAEPERPAEGTRGREAGGATSPGTAVV
jgi:hypothetical protein